MKIELKDNFDESLQAYLIANKLISSHDSILEYAKAGEGNMNVVMRLRTNEGSLILKQSRAYVNKYPQIAAPIERIAVEKCFYDIVNADRILADFSPSLLHFDAQNYLIVMKDLGDGTDFLEVYQKPSSITKAEIDSLCNYLIQLHKKENVSFPSNLAMRKLNHEHIFHFPYMKDNGFNLDDVQMGLQELAMTYKTDARLKKEINEVGKKYLKKGKSLLHGDFYLGSWLKIGGEVKVIDPEFGFLGDREFDLGVMLAHLEMAKVDRNFLDLCLTKYNDEIELDRNLLNQYQGVEIMRRLIGIAQLPMSLNLEQKDELLKIARKLILGL